MKKLILPLLALISIHCFSQTIDTSLCHDYLIKNYDQMTNKNIIISHPINLSGDSTQEDGEEIKIYFQKSTSDVIMVLQNIVNNSCIDTYNTIYFLFTDGSRLHFNSNTTYNCKGESIIYFGTMFGNEIHLKSLRNKKLKAIRVTTRNGHVEKNLSYEESEAFIQSLNCIYKYNYRWKGY